MKEDMIKKAIELRHQLHKFPELSNEETQTKKTLMEFLSENTELVLRDMGKWFYAEYHPEHSQGTMAFRADFDAIKVLEEMPLPYCSVNQGVSHKCGHDGHSAALAAFAMYVDQNGADKDVYFIFQHAEETGDGGEECAKLLEEKNISEVFAVHNVPGFPEGTIIVRDGSLQCASKGVEMTFTGASAHASEPENGKNPAFAISATVLEIQRILKEEAFKGLVLATIIQIDIGERAFGVSAHDGKLLLTIRGQYEDEMDGLQTMIEDFAGKQAEAYGLKLDFAYHDAFPETVNHKSSVDKVRKAAADNGWPLVEMDGIVRSSEDFGYYLKKTAGAMIMVGDGEDYPALHSEEFDYNDNLIEKTVNLFGALLK